MTILIWIGIVVGSLVGLFVLMHVIGSFLPQGHVMGRSLRTKQSPEAVWAVITDFANVPTWHPHVKKSERQPDVNGHELWLESHKGVGVPMRLETLEARPPHRLVRAIDDGQQFFRGRWEFEIARAADGSRITITEHGEILKPFVRCMARLFFNPAMYLDMYLKALAKKLGDEPVVEPAEGRAQAAPQATRA